MKSHASMNRIYRLVWNAALSLWVAVAENAKGRGPSTSSGQARGGSARSSVLFGSAPVGEAEGGGEGSGFTLKPACRAALALLAALGLCTPHAQAANAADATVSLGSGNVSTTGNTTTITQGSQRLAIDWTSLSTRTNEALVFAQPNAQAIALNRITGSSPSELLGSLTANGQVFILNPNGVLFGAGSQVNVGGLVASTLNMSNADFMAGNHVFTGSGASGSVVNQGTLNAGQGGYLALLAPEVRNEGVMTASLGTALLAAGNKVTLNLDNGSLLGYSIDQGAINALAQNRQLIRADGGQVLLGAKALDSLTSAAVNNTGIIEARTIAGKAGRILLMGDMETGTVHVGGTLDASAPNGGDGGFIETSAAHVKVAPGTRITTQAPQGKTGKWLIDPQDYTIAASGGDITGADLSAQLATTDVEIQSVNGAQAGNGDIHVNDAVSWSANKLTLTAERDINVNAVMSATGSASLALNTGASGNLNMKMKADGTGFDGRVDLDTSGTLHINGEQYTIIRSLGTVDSMTGTDLQGVRGNLDGRYVLGANIDASDTINWRGGVFEPSVGAYLYAGMHMLGSSAAPFTGRFEGLGHRIHGVVTGPEVIGFDPLSLAPIVDGARELGVFGATAPSAKIGNLYLSGWRSGLLYGDLYPLVQAPPNPIYPTGDNFWHGPVGVLVGANAGTVRNVLLAGNKTNESTFSGPVGGVAGLNTGTMQNIRVTGSALLDVSNGTYVGGVAGINQGLIEGALVEVDVLYGLNLGGLAGLNGPDGVIRDSVMNGSRVDRGLRNVGGAVGLNRGLIERVQSSANVPRGFNAGGLVGLNEGGAIRDSSASGSVTTTASEARDGDASRYQFWDSETQTWYREFRLIGGAGGLVGAMSTGTISGSHASGRVEVSYVDGITYRNAGGLVGVATWDPLAPAPIVIRDSWATGDVVVYGGGADSAGGFVGVFGGLNHGGDPSLIERSWASGNVLILGTTHAVLRSYGGFVGYMNGPTIRQSYATGNVEGGDGSFLGGFVGMTGGGGGVINDAYATGNVTAGNGNAGGFAGSGWGIQNAYATGVVSGLRPEKVRGFGEISGDSYNLFYNSTANPIVASGAVAVGKTEAELKQATTYAGFGNVSATGGSGSVWRIYEGQTTPLLTAFLKPLTVTADNVNKVYDGTSAGLSNLGYSDAAAASSGQVLGLANPYGNVTKNNVGSYAAGLYSTQQGYDITMVGGNLTVTPATLTVSGVTADNKVYDGGTAATLQAAGAGVSGVLAGDAVNFDANGLTGTFSDKNAGTGKTVALTGGGISGADAGNYTLASTTPVTASIDRRALTVSATGVDKVYDRSTGATVTLGDDRVANDVLTLGYGTAQFGDWNAGTNKAVSVGGIAVSGADAGNYTFNTSAATTASITPKAVAVSGITAGDKAYDQTTAATANTAGANLGLIAGDTVTISATGQFDTKDAGTGKTVTLTSSYGGADAGNYTFTDQADTTAAITPKAVTVSGITAGDKVYDQTTAATVSTAGANLGVYAGDNVTISATGQFDSKNAGNRTVNLTSTYGGADAGNYAFTNQAATTATITPASLTVSGITAADKSYNASDAATVNTAGANYSGLFAGDAVSVAAIGLFSDKNVGTGKTVSLSSSYSGADVGNYAITSQANTTASITQANLTLTTSNVTKTYDGGLSASGTAVVTAGTIFTGDSATGGTFVFTDKNVGTGNKTVTTSGVTVGDGVNNSNYNVTYMDNTSSTINQANLTVTATSVIKTYDGTTSASGTGSVGTLAGAGAGESVNTAATQVFTDKNFGVGNKTVQASGLTIKDSGNVDVTGNYNISYVDNTTSTINKADLTVTATGVTKTYDGTTAAAGMGTVAALAGAGAGEVVNAAGSQAFTDKNFGIGNKTVRASGVTIKDSGNTDVTGNYNIAYVDNTTSTINKADLTVTATGVTKTYDGTTSATGTGTVAALAGAAAGEVVNAAGSQAFLDKNAGTGNKTVRAAGVTIKDAGNADVTGNYNIAYVDDTTSTINKADLTVTATGVNKVYDGTTAATVGYGDNRVAGDVLGITGSATFADKNAGTGKAVGVSGIALGGADAGNYNLLNTTTTTTASISPKALAVTANNDSRLAGGAPYAGGNGVSYSGFVGGDTVADISGTLAYGGSSQGAVAAGNYLITPGGLNSISGNYALGFVDGALSIVAPNAGAVIPDGTAAPGGSPMSDAYVSSMVYVAGTGAGGNAGGSGVAADALAAAAAEAGNTDEE